MKRRTVSAIIPVHNCELYLAEAIESVLAQTYRPLEIIIVDDGSTDGSAEIARDFIPRVQYMYQPQAGTAAARNAGIELAQGNYLAFLDSDDIWMPDKLSLQIAIFEDDPSLDIVFGHARQLNATDSNNTQETTIGHGDEILPGYIPSAVAIKQESFSQVGLFSSNWQIGEWFDWYLKAIDQGLKSRMLTQVVVKRRIHTSNKGIRERDLQSEYVHILKATLDRRRKLRSSN